MFGSLLKLQKKSLLTRLREEIIKPDMEEFSTLANHPEVVPLIKSLQKNLLELDDQWQRFVHTKVDPLLGGERSRQLNELDIRLSPMEKDINRRLILAMGNIGIALVATQAFLPLAVANVAFIAWLGKPMYMRGYRALVDERRLTYPLVLLSAELAIVFGGHFVAGSVAIFIITVTNKIINRTEDHFRRNITDALGKQPASVWQLVNGLEVEAPLSAIRKGDVIVISGGEIIAVDGRIIAGAAMIDQHRLTGESQPAEKYMGDSVLASTVVLSGKIQVQVEKAGNETSAAQIVGILQQVSRTRISFSSRVQNFVDNMTLPMLGVGGSALLLLGTQGAASVLSVGVGSVARFGGPLSMLNYLNVAARHGLLIKDARSLELLRHVDTVVFDKTGTLTLEQPHVSRIYTWTNGNGHPISEDILLLYAAAAESKQSHPIAKAIVQAARQRDLTLPAIEDAHLEVGYGIKVRLTSSVNGNGQIAPAALVEKVIHVGSRRYMQMEGISEPAELEALQAKCHDLGHSLVLVGVDGHVAGALELQPTIRPEALEAITALKDRGVGLYIISGDHAAPTSMLAATLGIERYFAGVLPQDKAGLVEQLKAEGRNVCFVGDGINDALALGKANVSVSLSGASTLAIDTAQVVLMSQDLRHLSFLLQLAKEFDQSLEWLFRLTLVPVATVIASTFLLHTGIYTAITAWQLGMMTGIGIGFLPLWRHPLVEKDGDRIAPQIQGTLNGE
ncbi:heavy metal translocating P-type ATPase [bacterium]|nr:heavy metal translocating P-type ATPase [bacterium]